MLYILVAIPKNTNNNIKTGLVLKNLSKLNPTTKPMITLAKIEYASTIVFATEF